MRTAAYLEALQVPQQEDLDFPSHFPQHEVLAFSPPQLPQQSLWEWEAQEAKAMTVPAERSMRSFFISFFGMSFRCQTVRSERNCNLSITENRKSSATAIELQ